MPKLEFQLWCNKLTSRSKLKECFDKRFYAPREQNNLSCKIHTFVFVNLELRRSLKIAQNNNHRNGKLWRMCSLWFKWKSDWIKVQNEQHFNDFIADLFRGGSNHLVERIVKELPFKTISVCKEVSPEWCRIVQHFDESKVPRILRLKDFQICEEWRNKNYTIQSSLLIRPHPPPG